MTFKIGDILKSKEGKNYYIIALYGCKRYAFYKIGNIVVKILPELLENIIVIGNIKENKNSEILNNKEVLELLEYIKENNLLICK